MVDRECTAMCSSLTVGTSQHACSIAPHCDSMRVVPVHNTTIHNKHHGQHRTHTHTHHMTWHHWLSQVVLDRPPLLAVLPLPLPLDGLIQCKWHQTCPYHTIESGSWGEPKVVCSSFPHQPPPLNSIGPLQTAAQHKGISEWNTTSRGEVPIISNGQMNELIKTQRAGPFAF